MPKKFYIVVAADDHNGIGKDGGLVWNLPGDMAFFKRLTSEVSNQTKQNAVIMGRKTWESIPDKFRPLRKRQNIVISRQASLPVPTGVTLVGSLDEALKVASSPLVEKVFVIGGGSIYAEACEHPSLERVYWTAVHAEFECDTYFPPLDEKFTHLPEEDSAVISENGIEYVFKVFCRKSESARIPPPF